MPRTAEMFHESSGEERDLESWLLGAVAERSGDDLAALKELYQKRHPEEMESVEALFGFIEALDLREELAELDRAQGEGREADRGRIMDIVQELAGYNFLFTHFLLANGGDRPALRKFWETVDAIAIRKGASLEASKIKRGIVTQAATMRAFRQLGFKTELSKPADDLKKIDMWISGRHKRAVQIKRGNVSQVEIIETDEIAIPSAEVDMQGTPWHISSSLFYEAQRFKVKVDEYRKKTNKPSLKGYFVVVPHTMVDAVTGEPSAELIADIKARLADNASAKAAA